MSHCLDGARRNHGAQIGDSQSLHDGWRVQEFGSFHLEGARRDDAVRRHVNADRPDQRTTSLGCDSAETLDSDGVLFGQVEREVGAVESDERVALRVLLDAARALDGVRVGVVETDQAVVEYSSVEVVGPTTKVDSFKKE